jgi:pyridoxal phosphate-dependent aminotransferase EpsN
MKPKRIYLSAPHMGTNEEQYVREAFATNWISSIGPNLEAFEAAFQKRVGIPSVALSSGTAALHLGLRWMGVGPDDEVLCSTLTFVASANPIRYVGAQPVFLDSDRVSWNLDPSVLERALETKKKRGRLPKALILVHLYGLSADIEPILELCARYGVAVIEDAAEALGATYRGKAVGTWAPVGIYSFNGNKIITTSGGGMLVAHDEQCIKKVRFWSQQARDPGISYEHSEMGFNYRMSNVLAGIGRGQLEVLDERVAQKRAIFERYSQGFQGLEQLEPMPQPSYGTHTNWLSVFLLDGSKEQRDSILAALEEIHAEARPVWKPMHMQSLYKQAECFGGEVAEDLFERGICLPSSTQMTLEEQTRVIEVVQKTVRNFQGTLRR